LPLKFKFPQKRLGTATIFPEGLQNWYRGVGWWCGGVWVHERGRNVESTLSYGRLLAILGLF
jgi:hypothetical protein